MQRPVLPAFAPIIIGIVENLGIERKSRVAALLMVGAVQADTFWNIMIQTAAAQNLVAVGFMQTQMNTSVSWIDWLTAAAPFSIIMVIIAYFLTQALIKPEFKELVGGDVQLAKMRKEIGPMSTDEKKLLCISIGLLALWATGGKLHSIDTTTTTIIAIALFFFLKLVLWIGNSHNQTSTGVPSLCSVLVSVSVQFYLKQKQPHGSLKYSLTHSL